MKNIFNAAEADELIQRINKLTPLTQPLWGKMSVAQMLAHCNVTYELVYDNKYPKPNSLMRLVLKLLVKNKVVNETPYKQGSPTAPVFKITGDKDFELEKNRLTNNVNKTQQLGAAHFEGKESHSFGPLTAQEWNNMFYKHLDHHLNQFGV
jgi:hypothetical protein